MREPKLHLEGKRCLWVQPTSTPVISEKTRKEYYCTIYFADISVDSRAGLCHFSWLLIYSLSHLVRKTISDAEYYLHPTPGIGYCD
jgi:hypothetical protein